MFWWQLGYLFIAMFVCSLGLGIGIARRIVREPNVMLPIAIGVSGIVLYLAGWGIFVSNISWQWSYAITGLAVLGLILEWKQIRLIVCDPRSRGILLAWVALELWILLLQLCIRNWAVWVWDWLEHYDRAIFFLQHWPLNHPVQKGYSIPSRPPMMNVIEALFMAQVGPSYAFFQAVSGFLNATLFVAVASLAGYWSRGRTAKIVAALAALSPWFIQNSTYTWTKLYCAFYVVLGVWLYLISLGRETDPKLARRLRSLSLIMLAAGCVVHYSAAIYALFIAAHDLLYSKRQLKRIFATWGLCAVLIGTWIGWAWANYGFARMAGTNTTVLAASTTSAGALLDNYAKNALYSLVPKEIWHPGFATTGEMAQRNTTSQVSDAIFMVYQPALLFAWGTGGAIAIGWCIWRWCKKSGRTIFSRSPDTSGDRASQPGARFWIVFLVWIYVAGLLSDTSLTPYYGGVAHVLFQPIVWIGLAWLASQLRQIPRWLARLWAVGLAIDAGWLILHIWLEGRLMNFVVHNGKVAPLVPTEGSHLTLVNNADRIVCSLTFLGDPLAKWQGLILAIMIYGALVWWWSVARQMGRDRVSQ